VSWDLLVASYDRPDGEAVATLMDTRPVYSLVGGFGPKQNVVVTRKAGDSQVPVFTIDAPQAVETDDLPDKLVQAVLAPRFIVELSAPSSARSSDRALMKRTAKALAETFHGAVYDPQDDAMVWPKRRQRSYKASTPVDRIRVVNLAWYFGGRIPQPATVAAVVDAIRTYCPEALPRRYGDSEPFAHRWEEGGANAFGAVWRDLIGVEFGRSLYWTGQAPCFGGSVVFPDQRATYPSGLPTGIKGSRRCSRLSLEFDGRALAQDDRWVAATLDLFHGLTDCLGAFYAAAYVQRGVIAKRGLRYDDASEDVPMPYSDFTGLPPTRTWLAFFGEAYAAHVRDAVMAAGGVQRAKGWFFRGGETPRDTDQLRGVYPDIAGDLIFELPGEGGGAVRSAAFVPEQ